MGFVDGVASFELRDRSIQGIGYGSVGFDFLAKAIERHIDGAILEPPRQLSQSFQAGKQTEAQTNGRSELFNKRWHTVAIK